MNVSGVELLYSICFFFCFEALKAKCGVIYLLFLLCVVVLNNFSVPAENWFVCSLKLRQQKVIDAEEI